MSTDCSHLIRVAILDGAEPWWEDLQGGMRDSAEFRAVVFRDIDHFLPELGRHNTHIVLLGFGRDGGAIARLRQLSGSMGVMVLLEPGQDAEHRARSLDLGADMALSSGCLAAELFASIRAVHRRLRERCVAPRPWKLFEGRRLLLSPCGNEAALSQHEFVFLRQLADAFPQPVARQTLVQALGFDFMEFDERRLEALASRLRRKLSRAGLEAVSPLRSARLQGYFFTEPIQFEEFSLA